jgi:N-acetylated-alpha-linked acidic dipeptidase
MSTRKAAGVRPHGVQRGSVADMQVYPGDPLTPGIGSTPAPSACDQGCENHPEDSGAADFLRGCHAAAAGADRAGGARQLARLAAIHLSRRPSTAKVHLTVQSDWGQKPIYDVIATLKGSTEPDQWIVRGNHHDGWVFGAWDPLAGNVALMAEAKAIGALVKQGWRPQRTLVYASWDGEEPGLLGSTEWAETHAEELQAKAVLYVNSDTNGRGFLDAGGSHSLQHLVNQVAAGVSDPETHVSVRERLRAHMLIAGNDKDAKPEAKDVAKLAAEGGDVPIRPWAPAPTTAPSWSTWALRR